MKHNTFSLYIVFHLEGKNKWSFSLRAGERMEKSIDFCHFVVQSVENQRGCTKGTGGMCEIFSNPIVFFAQIVYTMTYRDIQGGTEK